MSIKDVQNLGVGEPPYDAYAQGKTKLVEPPFGSYIDTWWDPVNSNAGVTDAAVSGTTTVNVATISSASPFVTLTFNPFNASTNPTPWTNSLAGQNLRILVTGPLAFSISIFVPAGQAGFWFIDNQTTNSFTVTVLTTASGSSGVSAPQGKSIIVFSDGTNVKLADGGNVPVIATNTVYGVVTQGLLTGNCVNLDAQAKIPYQADKYIIAATGPDPAQGYQDWLWMQTSP